MVSTNPKQTPNSRRYSLVSRAGSRGFAATPQGVLVTAASVAAILVLCSYSVVPYITGASSKKTQEGIDAVTRATLATEKGIAALEQIERLFPKEVAEMMKKRAAEQNLPNSRDLIKGDTGVAEIERALQQRQDARAAKAEDPIPKGTSISSISTVDGHNFLSRAAAEGEDPDMLQNLANMLKPDPNDPMRDIRREKRIQRQDKRLHQLMALHTAALKQDNAEGDSAARKLIGTDKSRASSIVITAAGIASDSSQQASNSGSGSTNPPPISASVAAVLREGQDQMVKLIRDQIIMAKAYASLAMQSGNSKLAKELKARIKDSLKSLGDAENDVDLASNAVERMRSMGQVLSKAKEKHYDCTALVKKLRAMVHSTEDQNTVLRRQGLFLSQLAARTVPKGLFCLSMRLTIDYWAMSPEQQQLPGRDRLEEKSLFHYALFSDNVLACAVVVNSTITNCQDSSKHVFHIVTDKLNYGAMKAWFLLHPPGNAAIEVMNIDEFKWLNSSYCPVLRQLESASMKQYYFKVQQSEDAANNNSSTSGDTSATGAAATANLKYRNPKYLSMLNHLRFYLPEVFPKLDKILFVDDDIVVQRDLSPLWQVDLQGKVNGAVETCGASFHRFDKYLNFSNPHISQNFDPQACGWAYGMNMFDLVQWKLSDITGIYHHWQNLNEDRTLWKLGTLPPGLITFYNLTYPLEKQWHFLGLGYNPNLDMRELERAAVVHYNGNMKPWLEISMSKFKGYWSKYVDYSSPYLQLCNINP